MIDYTKHADESIDQYNTRIATARATPAVPATSTTPVVNPDTVVNPNTGKTNAQVLAESTTIAQNAAASIGQIYTPPPSVQGIINVSSPPVSPPVIPSPASPAVGGTYMSSVAQQQQDATSQLNAARDRQIAEAQNQKNEAQKQLDETRTLQENNILAQGSTAAQEKQAKLDQLTTETKRFDENYNIVQGLAGQLNNLLTEGQNAITQQKNTAGLASINTARVNQKISDVAAQAGVIQASISAYNGQMNQAQSQLTNAVNVITNAYSDQLDYYKTLNTFYESKSSDTNQRIITLTSDQKKYIDDKISTLDDQMKTAQTNTDYIKKLMQDPATALLAGQAGISLNMTPEQVNTALATAAYEKDKREQIKAMALDEKVNITSQEAALKPQNEVYEIPDARGNAMYFWKKATGTTTETKANIQSYLVNQGLPLTIASATGELTTSALNKVVSAGVPLEVARGIWANMKKRNSLEEIRQGIKNQGEDPSILDTFVQTLQGQEGKIVNPF